MENFGSQLERAQSQHDNQEEDNRDRCDCCDVQVNHGPDRFGDNLCKSCFESTKY